MSALGADLASALLPRHAQHVVLVHFPIASYIAGVGFDLAGRLRERRILATVAYYYFAVAAWSTLPTLATGVIAWRLQLEGQELKGDLRLHVVLACVSSVALWLVWRLQARTRAGGGSRGRLPLIVELATVVVLAGTGYLGGMLSGVNVPG